VRVECDYRVQSMNNQVSLSYLGAYGSKYKRRPRAKVTTCVEDTSIIVNYKD